MPTSSHLFLPMRRCHSAYSTPPSGHGWMHGAPTGAIRLSMGDAVFADVGCHKNRLSTLPFAQLWFAYDATPLAHRHAEYLFLCFYYWRPPTLLCCLVKLCTCIAHTTCTITLSMVDVTSTILHVKIGASQLRNIKLCSPKNWRRANGRVQSATHATSKQMAVQQTCTGHTSALRPCVPKILISFQFLARSGGAPAFTSFPLSSFCMLLIASGRYHFLWDFVINCCGGDWGSGVFRTTHRPARQF